MKKAVTLLILVSISFSVLGQELNSKENIQKGKACFENGNYQCALGFFLKAYNPSSPSSNPFLLKELGNTYFELQEYEKAREFYNTFVSVLSKYSKGYEDKFAYQLLEIGLKFYGKEKYDDALIYFYPMLKLYEKGEDTLNKLVAQSHDIIARSLFKTGNYSEALKHASKEIRIIELNRNDYALSNIINSYYDIASIHSKLGNYTKSNDYLDTCFIYISTYNELVSDDFYFLAYVKRIENYEYLEDDKKALEYNLKLLPISIKIYGKNDIFVGVGYKTIGYLQLGREEYEEAIVNLNNAVNIFKLKTKVDTSEVDTNIVSLKCSIGNTYNLIKQFELSHRYYLEALEIYNGSKLNDKDLLADIYINIASHHLLENNLNKGFYFTNLAIGTLGSEPAEFSKLYTSIYLILATIDLRTNKLEEALLNCDKAIAHISEYSNLTKLSVAYLLQGEIYEALLDFDKATASYKRVLNYQRESKFGFTTSYLKALLFLGDVSFRLEDTLQAREYYQKGLDLDTFLLRHNPKFHSHLYVGLGNIKLNSRKINEALKCYKLAESIMREHLDTSDILFGQIYLNLYLTYYIMESYEESYTYLTEYFKVLDNYIFSNILLLPLEERETALSKWMDGVNFYMTLSLFYGYDDSKFVLDRYLQYKKLSHHSETYIRESSFYSFSNTDNKKYKQLKIEKKKLSVLILSGKYDLKSRRKIDSLSIIVDILESEFSNSNFDNKRFRNSLSNQTDSIKKHINEEEACIEIVSFTVPDTDSIFYYAFVVRKGYEKPTVIRLFEESQLRSFMSKHSSIKSEMGSRYHVMYDYERNGSELYNLCWASIDSLLEGVQKVYVSPSGLLHNVSISILPINKDSILSDKYEFHYVSSISELSKVKTPSSTIGDISSVTMYSNISYDSNSYSKDDIERKMPRPMANQSNGTWTKLYYFKYADSVIEPILPFIETLSVETGYAASKQRFFDLDGNSSDIIHFFTHGFYYPSSTHTSSFNSSPDFHIYQHHKNPLYRTGLVMSGGNIGWKNGTYEGILTAMEILPLNLSNTDLVILSACVTGLGDIEPYEGVYGLQRAFKIAGVDNIIMTLWPVYDNHTKKFFEHFYLNLSTGQNVHDAFYSAQNTMRNEVGIDHWGGFVLLE